MGDHRMLAAVDQLGDFPDHPWRSFLQRSALTLKGLTYSPTGALLAASTTSLPETPQGERNWDYRYAWVRDSTFALWGLYTLGLDHEADDFFSFIADVSCANDGSACGGHGAVRPWAWAWASAMDDGINQR